MAREEGVEEIVVGLTYSVSPVHTHEYYAERARRAGRLRRTSTACTSRTPAACSRRTPCASSRRALAAAAGRGRSSCTATARSGWRRWPTWRALRAGFQALHTAVAPLAQGTSNPAAETTLRDLEAIGLLARARPRGARRRVGALPRAGARARACRRARRRVRRHLLPPPAARRDGHDHAPHARRASAARELFDAVLEEVGRVRAEMGYPIIVTPVSQFVATQAMHERDRRRALARRPGRDRSATSSATSASRPRRSTPRSPTACSRTPRADGAARRSSRSASTARASASAGASPTRSCCCA